MRGLIELKYIKEIIMTAIEIIMVIAEKQLEYATVNTLSKIYTTQCGRLNSMKPLNDETWHLLINLNLLRNRFS